MPRPQPASSAQTRWPVNHQLVVDTDMGYDDILAIAMLLAAGVPVAGITTVNGLANAGRGARNMLSLLARAARHDIPVAVGGGTPLSGNREFPTLWREEANALPGIRLPASGLRPHPLAADEFLIRTAAESPGPVTLLCLGPLTNVALALRRDASSLASHVTRIVMMGGAVRVPGNKTPNEVSEWNVHVDPEAASQTVHSGIPILMVGLDVTHMAPRTQGLVDELRRRVSRDPLTRIMQEALASMYQYLHDPVAAACLLDRSLVHTEQLPIRVVAEGASAGQTIEDPSAPVIDVALRLETDRFYDLLRSLVI
jgi:purine nucleosidase